MGVPRVAPIPHSPSKNAQAPPTTGRGIWGLGHVFKGKLYFTKDIVDDSFVPRNRKPKPIPTPKANPTPKSAPKGKHAIV